MIDGKRSGHVVTLVSGEAATARLSGFTITNGYAHGTSLSQKATRGFCSIFHPTLTHLRVTGNEATTKAGGCTSGIAHQPYGMSSVTNNLADTGGGGISTPVAA